MIEEKFNAAVNVIRSLPKNGPYQPSHDMMLKFYGLYKQATQGPCKEPKPSFYEVVKGYKWKAWSSLGDMSKTEAMNNYVEELKKVAKPFESMPSHIVETMAYSENVAAFFEALGPFYEYVELPSIKNSDSNHNITRKGSERASPDNFELISLCNGKGSPSMNGVQTSEESDENDEKIGAKSKPLAGPNHVVNGLRGEDTQQPSSSRKQDSKAINGEHLMMNGISVSSPPSSDPPPDDENSESLPGSPRKELSGVNSFKKFTSDTESDEEYSEPAETPELLQQKQRLKACGESGAVGNEASWESPNLHAYGEEDGSPVLQIMTCGGGDAADAGRIRLAQTYKLQETSGTSRGLSDPSADQAVTSFRGGGSGGRRRRDSDDPRTGERGAASMDVNTQLVRILQKIHLDLEAVLVRLDTLESHALSQHQQVCTVCQRRMGSSFHSSEKTSWWPFPELSPRSTFFLLTWPLILHGAVKFLIFLRSQRRKGHPR